METFWFLVTYITNLDGFYIMKDSRKQVEIDMDRTIKWDITHECNLRCKHCYNSEYFYMQEKKEPEVHAVIEAMGTLKEMGVTRIHYLGGEPLMAPALIPSMLFAKKNNITTTITTNGTLLTQNMAEMLFELNIAFLSVSLEGISSYTNDIIRGKGTFNNVVSNLKNVVSLRNNMKYKSKIFLTLTLNRYNLCEAEKILSFADNLGVDGVLVASLDKLGNAEQRWNDIGVSVEEKLDTFEKIVLHKEKFPNMYLELVCKDIFSEYLLKKYNWENGYLKQEKSFCNGADEEYYIQANGNIWPCHKCSEKNNEYIQMSNRCNVNLVPNIYDMKCDEIFNNQYLNHFFEFSRDIVNYENARVCRKCKYAYKCMPCPLECMENYASEECTCARKKLKELENRIKNGYIEIAENIKIDRLNRECIYVYSIKNQEKIILEELEKDVWECIQYEKLTVNELISSLYEEYKDTIEYTIFADDLLEFIYALRAKKVIMLRY